MHYCCEKWRRARSTATISCAVTTYSSLVDTHLRGFSPLNRSKMGHSRLLFHSYHALMLWEMEDGMLNNYDFLHCYNLFFSCMHASPGLFPQLIMQLSGLCALNFTHIMHKGCGKWRTACLMFVTACTVTT